MLQFVKVQEVSSEMSFTVSVDVVVLMQETDPCPPKAREKSLKSSLLGGRT